MSGHSDAASAGTQIGAEILDVHENSYGTSAGSVSVHLMDGLVVVLLDDIDFSLAERTLIDGGHKETVLRMRGAFQQAIEPTFKAIVERGTGSRVASFISTTSLSPPYSVELFRMAGAPGD